MCYSKSGENMLKIIVLNDNRNECTSLQCEHGLSLYIQTDKTKILFDAGQTDVFIKNAEKLGVDLKDLDSVVLSHGDYDHGNGLKFLNLQNKLNLFAHKDIFKDRISKRTSNYGGLNQSKEALKSKFNLNLSAKPMLVADNVIFLGQIEKINNFETGGLPMVDKNGKDYPHLDDSGIVIKTSKGLVIVSGCSHSGICNTVEYAKKLTGENEILAVVGGFHLKELDKKTEMTIKYFKENNIKNVLLAHCTADKVCSFMKEELPGVAKVVSVGKIYDWSVEC